VSFLELRGLSKRFEATDVLVDVSLEVEEGALLALLGLSGSGKTTLLRLLAGFETPDRGEIRINGQDVARLGPAERGFGMVFQHYALFPHLTVGENVAFGLLARGWNKDLIKARVDEMLQLVDLKGFDARPVSAISGGQQQRVALARALAPSPRLLLLDEPLSNLDPALRERTRAELRAAVERVGITTVIVTHEQEEAFHLGDRIAVLNRGRLEQVDEARGLYRRPQTRFVASFIGRASRLPGRVVERAGDRAQVQVAADVSWPARVVDAATPVEVGQEVELFVRPEALRLAEDGLPGVFRGRRFLGALTYGEVELADGRVIEVLLTAEPEPGTNVFLAMVATEILPTLFAAEGAGV
jgi:ABC-type Fe3+/spermidine/putrescine transport system ATPase subunit